MQNQLNFVQSNLDRKAVWYWNNYTIQPANSLSNDYLYLLNEYQEDEQQAEKKEDGILNKRYENRFKSQLINLKRLRIANLKEDKFKLDAINKFKELEQLELDILAKDEYLTNKSIKLELPILKILKIVNRLNDVRIEFETIELTTLSIDLANSQSIQINHPLAIENLQIKSVYDQDLISIFENLKYLHFNLKNIDNNSFAKAIQFNSLNLTKLEVLKTDLDIQFKYKDLSILNDILNFKRPELKFYYNGYLIEKIDEVLKYSNNKLPLQLDAYHLLSKFEDCKINYGDLMNIQLPGTFFQKYICIQEVTLTSRVAKLDEQNFIDFLNSCINLRSLNLTNTSLSQSFFIKISKNDHLKNSILELQIMEDKKINLAFVLNLINLVNLNTNQQLDFKLVKKIVTLEFVESIVYKLKRTKISILKIGAKKFRLNEEKDDVNDKDLLEEDRLNFSDLLDQESLVSFKSSKGSNSKCTLNQKPSQNFTNCQFKEFKVLVVRLPKHLIELAFKNASKAAKEISKYEREMIRNYRNYRNDLNERTSTNQSLASSDFNFSDFSKEDHDDSIFDSNETSSSDKRKSIDSLSLNEENIGTKFKKLCKRKRIIEEVSISDDQLSIISIASKSTSVKSNKRKLLTDDLNDNSLNESFFSLDNEDLIRKEIERASKECVDSLLTQVLNLIEEKRLPFKQSVTNNDLNNNFSSDLNNNNQELSKVTSITKNPTIVRIKIKDTKQLNEECNY